MLLVGLTGGIGSGKSTVAELLAERGAVVIDADALARRAVAPGTAGFDRVVERSVAHPRCRRRPRPRDAGRRRVRGPVASAELEAIVHPEVARLMAERSSRTATPTTSWCTRFRCWWNGAWPSFDVVVVVVADVGRRIDA